MEGNWKSVIVQFTAANVGGSIIYAEQLTRWYDNTIKKKAATNGLLKFFRENEKNYNSTRLYCYLYKNK